MLESLGRIQNPLIRSFTAAATVGSVVIMTGAIALGVSRASDDSAYRTAVYATLAGMGGGAVFGLLYSDGKRQEWSPAQRDNHPSVEQPSWTDWRNFVVVRKVKESEEITSFYVQPEDRGTIPNFQPGQFLPIKLAIPGQPRPVIRTYSLSDYADPCESYRISIKREPMPTGTMFMPGLASNFMHDHVQEGSVIAAKPPSGTFVLDPHRSLPAVLISNGVGITPMISMAKAVTRLNPDRPVWFVHGARNGRFHAFRDEIMAIAAQNPNLQVHVAYSRPDSEDTGYYHSTGYVDTELIQALIHQDAEYFLCGSPAFMQSLREGLKSVGVPDSQVFFEAFTKALPKAAEGGVSTSELHEATDAFRNGTSPHQAEVVFAESGETMTWHAGDGSLLEFAEENGLEPVYSCRQGICGTCACRLLEGDVEYREAPSAAVNGDTVLICVARPKTARVVLEL